MCIMVPESAFCNSLFPLNTNQELKPFTRHPNAFLSFSKIRALSFFLFFKNICIHNEKAHQIYGEKERQKDPQTTG